MIQQLHFKIYPDYNSKAPKWLWILGLIMYLSGKILDIAYLDWDNLDKSVRQNEVIDMMPLYYTWMFAILGMPIIEELAFRNWQSSKLYARIISILLIAAFLFYKLHLILALAITLLLAFIFFYKPSRKSRILGIIISSVIFSAIHLEAKYLLAYKMSMFISFTGLALIFNYLTWRYSIWWSILLHCFHNFVGTGLGGLIPEEAFVSDIVSIYDKKSFLCDDKDHYWGQDSIKYCGSIQNFTDVYYKKYLQGISVSGYTYQYYSPFASKNIDISIIVKNKSKQDYSLILSEILKHYQLKLDTIYSPIYSVELKNIDTIDLAKKSSPNEYYTQNIAFLKECVLRNFGLAFNRNDLDTLVMAKIPHDLLNNRTSNRNEILKALTENGIKIIADSNNTIGVISINEN